jgi:pimeloyl-ACP methyl ester carboxylesterase
VAQADGASLYFERRGSGPPLLLIPGGGGDCAVFGPLTDALAGMYTVISYDRRGNSRSSRPPDRVPTTLAEQAADALAVLDPSGCRRARIFGSSGGASVALEVAAHHPGAVEAVVAHEPPVPVVLDDPAGVLAAYDEIERLRSSEGWEVALRAFLLLNRLIPEGRPAVKTLLVDPASVVPAGPALDAMLRMSGNWEYMMAAEVQPFIHYGPALEAIVDNRIPIALGCGADTRGHYLHEAAAVVAARLGAPLVEFPGGHTGPSDVPGAFAAVLHATLQRL